MAHAELVEDLRRTRELAGDISVSELSLGAWGGTGRIDVLAMRPSWDNRRIRAYEVKATRSDLLSDLRSGKWKKYVPWCQGLVFAFPKDLAQPSEIPRECGVITRNAKGWVTRRTPPRHECERMEAVLFGVLLKQREAPWSRGREARIRQASAMRTQRMMAWALGGEMSKLVDRMEAMRSERGNGIYWLRQVFERLNMEPADDKDLNVMAAQLSGWAAEVRVEWLAKQEQLTAVQTATEL